MPFSLTGYVLAFGYLGIFIAIFAESGFFLGFFLPGDSLLFSIGLFAATGHLNIAVLVPLAILAAIAGDSLGYWMGSAFGRALFERYITPGRERFFLKAEYLKDTEAFFAAYGSKAILLSRFIPIIRTFTPIFAGIAEMRYRVFLMYNIVGGVVWTGGFLLISYYLGHIPAVRQYVSLIILGIIVLSVLPIAITAFKRFRSKKS